MKGRTNVLGGGVILNASIAEKEIKSGNIVAGDFVEYYSEQAEIPFVSNVIYTGIIGSYIIARSPSNAIALIKNERIISTYSTYSISNSLIAGNYIAFITQCRKEDDRYIVPGSDVTANFLAIHTGHHDVEYDNVILLLIRPRTCINPVIYGIDLKSVFTEENFNDFS